MAEFDNTTDDAEDEYQRLLASVWVRAAPEIALDVGAAAYVVVVGVVVAVVVVVAAFVVRKGKSAHGIRGMATVPALVHFSGSLKRQSSAIKPGVSATDSDQHTCWLNPNSANDNCSPGAAAYTNSQRGCTVPSNGTHWR